MNEEAEGRSDNRFISSTLGYQITKATNISSRPMMRMSAQWGVTHARFLKSKIAEGAEFAHISQKYTNLVDKELIFLKPRQ